MNVEIQSQGLRMTESSARLAKRSLRRSLGRMGEHVVAVDVFLKDANGPKGGVDKHAVVRVRLRNRQEITVETQHDNLYAAIKQSARRSARAVRRHLRKAQRIDKRRMTEQLSADAVPLAH